MKILLWLILAPILLIVFLLLSLIVISRLRITYHNKKTLTKADRILLKEASGTEVVNGCHLTSVAWSDMSSEMKNYSDRLKRINIFPTNQARIVHDACPCPSCGLNPEELVWIEYRTIGAGPGFREVCGYLSICPCCKKAVSKITTITVWS